MIEFADEQPAPLRDPEGEALTENAGAPFGAPLGATIKTSIFSGGMICLKCILNPWEKFNAFPSVIFFST